MCNFKHLPWINRGHYWAPPWAAWCAHWSTGNVSHSPIQWGWTQCALIQADTILIPLLMYHFFIHHKIHPTKQFFFIILLGQNNRNQCRCGYGQGYTVSVGARVWASLLCSHYAVTLCQAQEGPAPLPVLICINIYFFKFIQLFVC